MFYCPNCNNIYDITKNINSSLNLEQTGGQISDTPDTLSSITTSNNVSETDNVSVAIKKILSGDVLSRNDVKNITMDNLNKNTNFKKLTGKNKELVLNKLADMIPNLTAPIKNTPIISNAYFLCKNCGNNEPINPGTLIVRKVYGNTNAEIETEAEIEDINKSKEMANVKFLPLTRNYICPNKKCISHNDASARKARFYRMEGTFRIKHVCIACQQSWSS